jgi:poly(3-hydroxybutyrate) depolymerase
VIAAAAFLLLLPTVSAQAPAPGAVAAVRGGITPRVACAGDPRFSYALYLPKDYDRGRSWPVLFVFDPRGRGAFAAELFAEAAAAHGFVVASSNDTRSDDPTAPNAEAIAAMWADTHARIAVDEKRRYAAGFSGLARVAVRMGRVQEDAFAGVITVGGRLADEAKTRQAWPFALFGAAGEEDFNHPEMWRLESMLGANRTAHRIVSFEGGHEWLPKSLAMEALDWFAVRGIGGRASEGVVERYRAAVSARAAALEAAGRTGEALRAWQGLAEDLAGAGGSPAAAGHMERLGLPARRDLERVRKQTERDREWIDAANASTGILERVPPPSLSELLGEFEVVTLRKQAAGTDQALARSASRRLGVVATNAGFYMPDRLKGLRLFANAARSYELAAAIDPGSPFPHLGLARVHARSGNRKGALDALRAAAARGLRIPRQRLGEDPELSALAGDPAFEEILKSLPVDVVR